MHRAIIVSTLSERFPRELPASPSPLCLSVAAASPRQIVLEYRERRQCAGGSRARCAFLQTRAFHGEANFRRMREREREEEGSGKATTVVKISRTRIERKRRKGKWRGIGSTARNKDAERERKQDVGATGDAGG